MSNNDIVKMYKSQKEQNKVDFFNSLEIDTQRELLFCLDNKSREALENKLSDEDKELYNNNLKEYFNNLSDSEKDKFENDVILEDTIINNLSNRVIQPKKGFSFIDPVTGQKDNARHPVFFPFYVELEDDSHLGFLITSHPESYNPIEDLCFSYLPDDDIDFNSNRSMSFVRCENIYDIKENVFSIDESKNADNDNYFFVNHGIIKNMGYIITDIITKHVLLQENGLAAPDKNTERLLITLEIEKEDIMKTKKYEYYQNIINHPANKAYVRNLKSKVFKKTNSIRENK